MELPCDGPGRCRDSLDANVDQEVVSWIALDELPKRPNESAPAEDGDGAVEKDLDDPLSRKAKPRSKPIADDVRRLPVVDVKGRNDTVDEHLHQAEKARAADRRSMERQLQPEMVGRGSCPGVHPGRGSQRVPNPPDADR